jgi:protocatechuate 3,4-dioxygenase beta subunit
MSCWLTRGAALRALGAAALLARSGDRTAAAATSAAACPVTPQGEIGPFFADDSAPGFERNDIRANLDGTNVQRGIPLTLRIAVRDARNGCAALAGTQVDVWHCNAEGVYSDEPQERTSTQTWLRGYQRTGAAGLVTFTTIFPGWYEGRTTHIHLRIRSPYSATSDPRDGTNTTQLFFKQATIETVSTTVAPYRARGRNPLTNDRDDVFAAQTRGATLVDLHGSVGAGFVAAFAVNLPISRGTG